MSTSPSMRAVMPVPDPPPAMLTSMLLSVLKLADQSWQISNMVSDPFCEIEEVLLLGVSVRCQLGPLRGEASAGRA